VQRAIFFLPQNAPETAWRPGYAQRREVKVKGVVPTGVDRGALGGLAPQREWEKFAQPFWLCKRGKYIRESNCECECD